MEMYSRVPTISDDTLVYSLYPAAEQSQDRASVAALATLILTQVEALLPGHLWHRDAFELNVVAHEAAYGSWHLDGRMRVGDCVDDEWLVVWLLRMVSARWDVVVR